MVVAGVNGGWYKYIACVTLLSGHGDDIIPSAALAAPVALMSNGIDGVCFTCRVAVTVPKSASDDDWMNGLECFRAALIEPHVKMRDDARYDVAARVIASTLVR